MKGLSENIAKTTQILKHSLLKTSYSWSMNIVGKKINKWINIQIYIYRERDSYLLTRLSVKTLPKMDQNFRGVLTPELRNKSFLQRIFLEDGKALGSLWSFLLQFKGCVGNFHLEADDQGPKRGSYWPIRWTRSIQDACKQFFLANYQAEG